MPSKFKPPVKEEPEFEYSDRLQCVICAHEQESQECVPRMTEDRREKVTALFARKHPEITCRINADIATLLIFLFMCCRYPLLPPLQLTFGVTNLKKRHSSLFFS